MAPPPAGPPVVAPVVAAAPPPPFDAFQASLRLAVGMPTDIAIARIGAYPISSQVTNCGTFSVSAAACEILTFGGFWNNQLNVYVQSAGDGTTFVSGWLVQKS